MTAIVDRSIRFVRRRPVHVLLAVVVTPVLVAVVRAIAERYTPVGDNAIIGARARDVLTAHHPLLGTWSSASIGSGTQMNHPGPLLFEVVAAPVKVVGLGPGLVIGVGAMNAVMLVLAAWAGHRLGGRLGALTAAAGGAALAWTMGSELLIDVWQPHAMILPCYALLWIGAAMTQGHLSLLPVAVGVASLLAQSHIAYLVVAPMLGTVGVVGLVVARRHDPPERHELVNTMAWSLGVLLVLWAQPLLEQLANGRDGNLYRIVTNSGGDETVGLRLGARLAASVVALPPWWSRSSFIDSVPITFREASTGEVPPPVGVPSLAVALVALMALVALLAWATVRARRHGDALVAGLGFMCLGGLLVAAVTLLLMPLGPIGLTPHQMRWLWPLSVLCSLVVLVVVLRWLADRATGVVLAVVAVVASVANVPAFAQPAGPTADRQAMEQIRSLQEQLVVLEGRGSFLFDETGLRYAEPYSAPVLAELQRRGIAFFLAEEGLVRQFGERRRSIGREDARLALREGLAAVAAVQGLSPEGEVVAFADGLSTADRQRLDQVESALYVALVDVPAGEGIILTERGLGAQRDGLLTVTPNVDHLVTGELAVWLELGWIELVGVDPDIVEEMVSLRRVWRWYTVAVVVLPLDPP